MKMVDEKEIEDIKRLPPKERLKKLQDLEAKRKRQEEESKRLVEESLKEIKLDEMLKEIDVPQQKKVDIDRLFEAAKGIEDDVAKAAPQAKGAGGSDYGRKIQELLSRETVHEIQNWYKQADVPPSREEFLQVYEHAREAYDMVKQSMQKLPNEELYSTPSQALVEDVVSSMRVLRALGYRERWFGPGGGA
jgi:hypothetical protein